MLDLIKSRYPKFLSATACRYASLSQETSTVNDSCSGTRTWDKQDEFEIYDVKSDSWRTLDVKLHWGWGEEYFHVSTSLKGNT
ncbi:unnamed protein product [Brassica rapa]|uniref:F-box associated beta-propeller type 1 domain-containing protein n=2 Tax=Brassica TaxID=3705 RepID=A0A3P5YFN8_BRACM|nr:unnamed protein product [Brassica napus]CAG7865410.1 unnamed protein product [Brassica rapa]VDC62484.1 unnamed protein product [Brassica rapa]